MEATLKISTFLNVDLSLSLAQSWRRYFAFIIDWAFKGGYIFLILYYSPSISIFENYWVMFFVFFPVYFYSFLLEWLFQGRTLGKALMKIKVVNADGIAPSAGQCFVRWIFLFIDAYSTVLLAFVSSWSTVFVALGPVVGVSKIERSETKQRFGDLAAKTFIVNAKEEHFSIKDTVYAYTEFGSNYQITYPQVLKFSDKDLTLIKNVLDRSEKNYDQDLVNKLAVRVKEILEVETTLSDLEFLKVLLKDYNYLSAEV